LAANAKALKEYDWIVYWKTNDRPAESPNEAISHDPHPNSSPDDPYGSGNSGPMRIFPGEKGDMLLFQRKFREKGDMLLFQDDFRRQAFSAPSFAPFFRFPGSGFRVLSPGPPILQEKGDMLLFQREFRGQAISGPLFRPLFPVSGLRFPSSLTHPPSCFSPHNGRLEA